MDFRNWWNAALTEANTPLKHFHSMRDAESFTTMPDTLFHNVASDGAQPIIVSDDSVRAIETGL